MTGGLLLTVLMIRTGLLSIPHTDDAAAAEVLERLHGSVPNVVVMQEGVAGAQRHVIAEILRRWADELELDLILTIGGTLPAPGPAPREATPEATLAVVERIVPGLPETMRMFAQEENPLALLDRGVAGIRGRTLIVNLPAGAQTVGIFLEPILDLIAPIIAHLQELDDAPVPETWYGNASNPTAADGVVEELPDEAGTGLNAQDFAAFLRRNDSTTSGA